MALCVCNHSKQSLIIKNGRKNGDENNHKKTKNDAKLQKGKKTLTENTFFFSLLCKSCWVFSLFKNHWMYLCVYFPSHPVTHIHTHSKSLNINAKCKFIRSLFFRSLKGHKNQIPRRPNSNAIWRVNTFLFDLHKDCAMCHFVLVCVQ